MATVLLVRHGRTRANSDGILAGRTPGVALDEEGERQAKALAARLAPLPLVRLVTSPLKRCRQTTAAVVSESGVAAAAVEERLAEVRYGEWEGRQLKQLAKEELWRTVQQQPSAVTFPGGESLRTVQARAVEAIRSWDATLEDEHGPDAVWALVSHGDVLKAILADALGSHLDQFQRIVVDPCSVSVVHYTPTRPFVSRLNDTNGDLTGLIPSKPRRRRGRRSRRNDAVVGGGSGAGSSKGT